MNTENNVFLLNRCLYAVAGGSYRPGKVAIYTVLDWKNNPKRAIIFSILAVIVTPIAHTVFCWGVYKVRMWIKSLYIKRCQST